MVHLDSLEHHGAMYWRPEQRAWSADPAEMVKALQKDGFREYKHEVVTRGRSRTAWGGMWQGLDPRNGTVATVTWVMHMLPPDIYVFIEVGGRWIEGRADESESRDDATRSLDHALAV